MPVARIVQRGFILLSSLLALILCQPAFGQVSGGGEQTGKRTWWLPEDVSTTGAAVDWLFYVILWMTLVVGAAVFIVLILFLIKYRYNPNRTAVYIHGNNKLEIVWTLIPALLMAGTAAISQASWAKIKNPPVGEGPNDWPTDKLMVDKFLKGEVIHCEVVAQQFNWVIRYPGRDGKMGNRNVTLMGEKGDPAVEIGLNRGENVFHLKNGNTLRGIVFSEDKAKGQVTIMLDEDNTLHTVNRSDIAKTESWGKDDILSRVMVVPVNKKVFINLSSTDVLHSFFLPNMRIKQDAVPGLEQRVWFEATKLSEEVIGRVASNNATPDQTKFFSLAKPFEIVCAELCGLGHSSMRGELYVVKEEAYKEWMKDQQKLQDMMSGGDEDGF